MDSFWISVNENTLCQGDLLPGCLIPVFPGDFADSRGETQTIPTDQGDLIIITQSCDLEHGKIELVALCPVWSIIAFEEAQTEQGRVKSQKGWREYWNNIRKGRSPTLHLLASPTSPMEPRSSLVVDFRTIYSLPCEYLTQHAAQFGDRWRLRSPFLEHFSQAFARSFMRVGLPSSVPEF